MKLWQIFFLLLLTIIIFGQYIFNPVIIGADTYYYINTICGISGNTSPDIIFNFLLNYFPCNFIILKIYLAILFFTLLFVSAKIGELYNKEDGWILSLIIGFLTMISLEFIVFENDSLGYVLLFASLYFILKAYKQNKKIKSKENLIGFILLLIAGLIWKGSIYFFIPFIILSPIFIIPFLIILSQHYTAFLWFIMADPTVQEHMPLSGLMYVGIPLLFLAGLIKMSKKEVLICVLMIVPTIFVQKLYVLAIPFVAISALLLILSLKKYKDTLLLIIITLSLFMAVFFGMHTYNLFPTPGDFNLVQEAASYTDSIQNTFGVGYIAIYNGLNVSSFGYPSEIEFICDGYVLDHPWLDKCEECEKISESDNLILRKC
jgi:hypothetical protein